MAKVNNFTKEFEMLYTKAKANLELGGRRTQKTLEESIQRYFDSNAAILSDTGLFNKPIFTIAKDQQVIYDAIGLTAAEITVAIDRSNAIENSWKVFTNSFYIACTLIIRYYVEKKQQGTTRACYMYLTINFYSSIYRNFFRINLADRSIMDYTINNLSNKYDIKRLGSLHAALSKLASNNHKNNVASLFKDNDKDFMRYRTDLRTRVLAFVRRIANEFYDNYKAKIE